MEQWEKIVTDGHVMAARIRSLTPRAGLIASLLMLLGAITVMYAYTMAPPKSDLAKRNGPALEYLNKAEEVVDAMQAQAFNEQDIESIPPYAEVDKVVETITKALDSDNEMPSTLSKVLQVVTVKDFFGGKWPLGKIVYVRKDNDIFIGAWISAYNRPRRWMSLFKKFDNKWEAVAIDCANRFSPKTQTVVRPSMVAKTIVSFTQQ